eukprot:100796-Chlamydomonas_euryale.AAC.2
MCQTRPAPCQTRPLCPMCPASCPPFTVAQMEGYFSQDTDAKMRDVRPDLHYQAGPNTGRPHFVGLAAKSARQPGQPHNGFCFGAVPIPAPQRMWRSATSVHRGPVLLQALQNNACGVVPPPCAECSVQLQVLHHNACGVVPPPCAECSLLPHIASSRLMRIRPENNGQSLKH